MLVRETRPGGPRFEAPRDTAGQKPGRSLHRVCRARARPPVCSADFARSATRPLWETKEPRRMSSIASPFRRTAFAAFAVAAGLAPLAAQAEVKKDFKVCWSIYVGWMPWGYIEESGIMDLHAKKYGINVEIV